MSDKIDIALSPEQVERARVWMLSTIKRVVSEAGNAQYDAGTISHLMSDLRALDFVNPTLGSNPASVATPSTLTDAERSKTMQDAANAAKAKEKIEKGSRV